MEIGREVAISYTISRDVADLAPSDDPPHHWIAFDDPPDLIML
jgi:hypothetical protein